MSISGEFFQELLRDRFVYGLRRSMTQKKLLTEDGLSYERAIQIAVSQERAGSDTAALKEVTSAMSTVSMEAVHKVEKMDQDKGVKFGTSTCH